MPPPIMTISAVCGSDGVGVLVSIMSFGVGDGAQQMEHGVTGGVMKSGMHQIKKIGNKYYSTNPFANTNKYL